MVQTLQTPLCSVPRLVCSLLPSALSFSEEEEEEDERRAGFVEGIEYEERRLMLCD